MKLQWVGRANNSRLILIFSGWGVDPSFLCSLSKPGYDIAAVYDYRDLSLDLSPFAAYEEIVVIAWSFGVVVADSLDMGQLPVTLRLAVNGTTTHIDDHLGIPADIFRGTLANLDERNLGKFCRRICGSARETAISMRPLEQVLPELEAFASIPSHAPLSPWDKAVVSLRDAIFPPANQLAAWDDVTSLTEVSQHHLPDFQALLDRFVKDKQLVARKFGAHQHTYADAAHAQRCVAERLWQLWEERVDYTTLDSAIEIGCGDGTFTRVYAPHLRVGVLTLWDITDCRLDGVDRCFVFNRCDAETAIRRMPSDSADLILSSSTLQWMNSPAAFLREAYRVLKPGGHCLLSIYGTGTFCELAKVSGLSLDYPTSADIRRMTADFFPVAEEYEELQILFPSPREAFRHIHATGVNALRRKPLGVADTRRIIAEYPLMDDGTAAITFHPIYLILQKPNRQ